MPPSDYKKAYESAKQELAELITTQDRVGKRILSLRESLKALATLCESDDLQVEPSAEAAYLLENSKLNEEIQAILKSRWPQYQRPHEVKAQLEALGHDLTKYSNPQAAIQMVLKRMVESGDAQEDKDSEGKQIYRFPPMWQSIAEKFAAIVEQGNVAVSHVDLSKFSEILGPAIEEAGKFSQFSNNPLKGKKLK